MKMTSSTTSRCPSTTAPLRVEQQGEARHPQSVRIPYGSELHPKPLPLPRKPAITQNRAYICVRNQLLNPITPQFETIGLIALLALAANALCLLLLWRHRTEDVNMRSVWLCSRNDIVANASVLFAALGVGLTNSQWPDLFVGLGIAVLFLRSAFHVFKDATATYAENKNTTHRTFRTLRIPPR